MRQYSQNIMIDGAAATNIGGGRIFTPDPTQAQHYETQVASVLDNMRGSLCGQILIREIMGGGLGKNVRIVPTPDADARSVPGDQNAASPYNKPLRFPGDLPNTPQVERAGQVRTGGDGAAILGTGTGSNTTIQYHPMPWLMETFRTGRVGNVMPDDVLFHELVHALRMMSGMVEPMDMGNADHTARYGNTEEFYAVLITNIYLSERNAKENRGQALRGNVGPIEQFQPLTGQEAQSKMFYERYKPSIQKLCREMIGFTHGGGVAGLKDVPAPFNPIRDCEEESEMLRQKYYGGLGLPDFPSSR